VRDLSLSGAQPSVYRVIGVELPIWQHSLFIYMAVNIYIHAFHEFARDTSDDARSRR